MPSSCYPYVTAIVCAFAIVCLMIYSNTEVFRGVHETKMMYRYTKPKHALVNQMAIKTIIANPKYTCNFQRNLPRILLAINFNEAFYNNVPLLRSVYEPHFGKLIFCGPVADATYNVMKIDGLHGYQGYGCLAKAIELHPNGFVGYFHTNDDVLLNIWNLNYDTNQVWLGTHLKKQLEHKFGQKHVNEWIWWNTDMGAKSCEKAFQALYDLSKTQLGKDINLKKYFDYYYKNTNKTKICQGSWSDAFYIPQRYANVYKIMADIFAREKVFLEIGAPTIKTFLGLRSSQINIKGMYYGDVGKSFHNSYNFDITFSHPFKLSSNENVKFLTHTVLPEMYKRIKECAVNR